jgi:RND family efflux transporter MFP subunit
VLATIVQLDPIWVNFSASERDVLQVRAALASRGETTASLIGIPVEVGLQTEDGYPHPGKLDYVAPTVNASTGTLAARAVFDNPVRALLPGYFVRVRIASRRQQPALLVPNVALGSDQGGPYVLVVNQDNVVEQRKVDAGQVIGDLRVIESGLGKDDRVIVGGIMRAIPGEKVDADQRSASVAN